MNSTINFIVYSLEYVFLVFYILLQSLVNYIVFCIILLHANIQFTLYSFARFNLLVVPVYSGYFWFFVAVLLMNLSFKYIPLENPLILLDPAADRPVLLHIVTVNLLAIILFIKNRILRTRSMYLVISLTVADMLVGVLCGALVQFDFLQGCRLIKLNFSLEVIIPLSIFFFSFLLSP